MSNKFEFAIEILRTELYSQKAIIRRMEKNEHEVMTNFPKEKELARINELSEAIELLSGHARPTPEIKEKP